MTNREPSTILTEEQIVACLSHAGDRQAMLQAAARMGMLRAAEIADRRGCDCGDCIRAAAEASPPPREPSPKS